MSDLLDILLAIFLKGKSQVTKDHRDRIITSLLPARDLLIREFLLYNNRTQKNTAYKNWKNLPIPFPIFEWAATDSQIIHKTVQYEFI